MENAPGKIEPAVRSDHGTKILHAITIRASAVELHDAILDRACLAKVLPAPARLHWQSPIEFEFWSGDELLTRGQIINCKAGELIAWRTDPASTFPHAGTIRFDQAPAGVETELVLQVEYEATLAEKFAALFGNDPGSQAKELLQRFKALMEEGEISTR